MCSVKNGVLKNFVNFTGIYLYWSLFLIKLQTQVFSREHCEIFRNTYYQVHLRTTASVFLKSKLHIIYILTENFIFSFRIYKIFSYLLSFANFNFTKFVFAFAFFSHTISNISPNISNVSFSCSLNRLNAFTHYQKFLLIGNAQNRVQALFSKAVEINTVEINIAPHHQR